MDIRHWGAGLRAYFGMTLALPLLAFGVVTWFSLSVIDDFVDIAKQSITELPAEKGIEIANLVAQVHDRAEMIAIVVPAAAMALVALVFGMVFAALFSKLTGICASVFDAAFQMNAFGTGLSQSAEKLWNDAEESGRAVEQYVENLEVLADVLHRSAGEVADADKVASDTAEETARGERELRGVAAALGELEAQNKKLEEVINAIDSIAFQTNILAVNAAVEAARAGEQGRGFGIVADAVKSLAQHSTASAKNIADLIQQNNETSKRAYEAAQSGAHSLSQATMQAKRSQELISKIASSTHEMTDSVARLAQSFNQIDSAAEHILTTVEQSFSMQDKFGRRSAELFQSVEGLSRLLLAPDSLPEKRAEDSTVQPTQQSQMHAHTPKPTFSKRPEPQPSEKPLGGKTGSTSPVSDSQNSDLFARARAKSNRGKGENTPRSGRASPSRLRARDVIPFEGETETESTNQVRFGTTSGF